MSLEQVHQGHSTQFYDNKLKGLFTAIVKGLSDELKNGLSVGDSKEELLEDLLDAYRMSDVEQSTSKINYCICFSIVGLQNLQGI